VTTINSVLSGWNQEQLSNLGAILELDTEEPSITDLESGIKWLYYSKTRANLRLTTKNIAGKIAAKLNKKERQKEGVEHQYPIPLYSELIEGLADKLKLKDKNASLADYEEYISHEIIIEALNKMSPPQRRMFFNHAVDLGDIVENADIKDTSLKGPITTISALGLAHASGNSLYLASTTALGFVTHAAGVSLPFVAYTGMTSTIAFVIGPAGWLAAGSWAFWKATGPEWKKLTPAILYIISTNSRTGLASHEN
jgi:uncharacterized protein YaaW (UPF0174 family)